MNQPQSSTLLSMSPDEQYLTRQQVADKLNIHPETVKRMAKAGKLRSFVFSGTLVRHPLSDVQRLIQDALSPIVPAK